MSATPDDAAISLEDISKRFAHVEAVGDVSLAIRSGEFVSLLGPSGCGKTTILRIIGGFETQDVGTVRVHGEIVDGLPPNRRAVNTVFQRYALFPHMTVGDNLAFPLKLGRVKRAERKLRVAAMLELVHLPNAASTNVSTLSGGQAQRVALARALIGRPKVLLLDEPLAALDLKLRKALQLELRRVQEEVGTTFFYVTHDQEEALTMSDRIVLMNEGRIVQMGTPEDLYERPASVFASSFIGESNLLQGVVASRDGGCARVSVAGGELITRPGDAHPHDHVTVSVRPERIRLRNPSDGGLDLEANALKGRVVRRVYLGHIVRWLVEVAPEVIVTVEGPADVSPQPREEERVLCTWHKDDTAILNNPESDPPRPSGDVPSALEL